MGINKFLCVVALLVTHGYAFAATSDADFAKGELSRIARSKLSGNQAQTLNMIDRFQRNKAGQKKRAATASPAVPAGESPMQSADSGLDGGGRNLRGADSALTEGSYGLTPEECAQRVSMLRDKKPEKGIVKQAQTQLQEISLYDYNVDGIFGERTANALQRFCESAEYAAADDLLAMLYKHDAITKAQPQWKAVLDSRDFRKWAGSQRDVAGIEATLQYGSGSGIIALIERFKKRKLGAPVLWAGDSLVSYSLSKDDLARLKSPMDMVKIITALQSKSYASEIDFDAALESAFKGISGPERYLNIVKKYAEPINGLMITDESLKRLKIKRLPESVLKVLQDLKGLHYPETQLTGAIEEAMNPIGESLAGLKPEDIVKFAEIKSSGAQLTVEAVKRLVESREKDDPVTELLGARLQKVTDIEYSSSKTMSLAMRNVLKQMRDEFNNLIPLIVAESEASTTFSISDDAVQKITMELTELAVPELYLDMLGEMQNLDYPSPELFWLAAKAKISMVGPNHIMKRAVMLPIASQLATAIDDAVLARLREDKVSRAVIAQIATLKNKQFDSVAALEEAIEEMFGGLSEDFEVYQPLLTAQARKVHKFDKSKQIQWSGGQCNCVHSRLSGEVYGFYPYWLAGNKHEIDFSLATRIGYVGLGFDDRGDIPDAERWSSLNGSFIREAQSYGTKVDLVVQRMSWKTWSGVTPSEKAAAFEKLADNIVNLINVPLTDWFSEAKPYISLGLSNQPVMGNGVTLYFEGYPQDPASMEAFKGLILSLRDKLRVHKREFAISIMFRSSEIHTGIYSLPRLAELRNAVNDKYLTIRYLVLLQEPTTLDKKVLRTTIEDGLPSADRMKVLRSVVMITTYDGLNARQLNADVIFAENNFGGIGFWYQPFTVVGEAPDSAIRAALTKWYMTATVSSNLQNSELCRYVCPQRWAFRITWAILLLTLAGCAVLYYAICEIRSFMEKHFIWFVGLLFAPIFLLGMALMSCDPAWAEISQGNDVLALVVIGIMAYSIWNHWDKKRQADLP